MSEIVSKTPRLWVGEKKITSEECKLISEHYTGKEYSGNGISLHEHPLYKKPIKMKPCNCGSFNAKVIFAKYCIHPMSGDLYWDYEIFCPDCKKYTLRSYAEN